MSMGMYRDCTQADVWGLHGITPQGILGDLDITGEISPADKEIIDLLLDIIERLIRIEACACRGSSGGRGGSSTTIIGGTTDSGITKKLDNILWYLQKYRKEAVRR